MENDFGNLFTIGVYSEFHFLVDEFNFQLIQDRPFRFIASTLYCRVMMEFEKGHFFCWIENPIKDNKNILSRGINVKLIAICKGYQISEEPVFYTNQERIINELKEYSTLLKEYCLDFLRGDFLEWSKINDCLDQHNRAIENEKFQTAKLSSQQSIREKAKDAWASKDYQGVVNYYTKILDILSPSEVKRLEYAKKQIHRLHNQ